MLCAVCDDYENVDQCILHDVATVAARSGWTVERPEIVQALADLVRDGLVKAYRLAATKPCITGLEGMPPIETPEEYLSTYFYATKEGKDHNASMDIWLSSEDD